MRIVLLPLSICYVPLFLLNLDFWGLRESNELVFLEDGFVSFCTFRWWVMRKVFSFALCRWILRNRFASSKLWWLKRRDLDLKSCLFTFIYLILLVGLSISQSAFLSIKDCCCDDLLIASGYMRVLLNCVAFAVCFSNKTLFSVLYFFRSCNFPLWFFH